MKRLLVLMIVVLVAVLMPTGTAGAQSAPAECNGAVAVEGRCVAVDDQATVCLGDLCVEFVQESVDVCPGSALNVNSDPATSPHCKLVEPALQGDDFCPEGTRGEVGNCFIYVAVGNNGCPTRSFPDSTGNCFRPIGDAAGSYFCPDVEASLAGLNCISQPDPIPSPCPSGTSRIDDACWGLDGLVAPEGCAGHQVPGTVALDSGRCQVPLAIPTGPSTCVDGTVYVEYPSYILIDRANQSPGDGPSGVACIDETAEQGAGVAPCFFPDDTLPWRDYGEDDLCSRFADPTVATCPAGFSIDDSLGGACARFEPAVAGQCPAGADLNGTSCVFLTEFAEFECPAETTRHEVFAQCVARRAWQGAVRCGNDAALIESGGSVNCLGFSGPQPDKCNGEGDLALCFEIREPAPIDCAVSSGCVAIGAAANTCAARPVTINMNDGASGEGSPGVDVILGTPGDDVIHGFGGDDVICGGDGRDRIFGGDGDDTIAGGFGIDYLFGETGEDTLDGGGGSDRLRGGAGNDLMLGDSGADRMYGGPGNDEMRGMGGQDFMWGDAGDDLMQGNFQTDNMWGGPGNDVMFGAGGKDSLFGETGNDELSGGNNTDYLDGGPGADIANGGRGRDKPLLEPEIRASNGQFFDGSGCIAETILNCQPTP